MLNLKYYEFCINYTFLTFNPYRQFEIIKKTGLKDIPGLIYPIKSIIV